MATSAALKRSLATVGVSPVISTMPTLTPDLKEYAVLPDEAENHEIDWP